jgi:hypothetical protein
MCRKDRKELLAREEFIQELSQWGEEKKVPLPGMLLLCCGAGAVPALTALAKNL